MDELSDWEKSKRRDAVDFATASVQLEGFTASQAWLDMAEKFVQGEITLEQLRVTTTTRP